MIAWWCCGCLVGGGVAVSTIPGLSRKMIGRIHKVRLLVEQGVERIALKSNEKDLVLCGRTPSELVTQKLLYAVLGGVGTALVVVMFEQSVGLSGRLVAVPLAVVGSCVGFVLPDLLLRKMAAQRRRDYVHSFSGFLDLVNVLLAGGAGIETALVAAADAGDGPAFESLRIALTRAQTTHRSPWAELHELGNRIGVDQIIEVSGSLQLAGEHGARVRSSLAARADSLRFRQMTEIEASANAATERMGLPMVMLFVGFLVLIGYPAVINVIGGL